MSLLNQEGGSAGGKGAPGTDAGLEEEKQNNELGTAKTQRDKLAQEVQQLKAEISITKSDLDSTRKEKDKQNTHKNLLSRSHRIATPCSSDSPGGR
jgi:peptidoglycan hydrolase CwlO-like protein